MPALWQHERPAILEQRVRGDVEEELTPNLLGAASRYHRDGLAKRECDVRERHDRCSAHARRAECPPSRRVQRRLVERAGRANHLRVGHAAASVDAHFNQHNAAIARERRIRGVTVAKGNGVPLDADATFLGGSPAGGVLSVGGRNIPATSTTLMQVRGIGRATAVRIRELVS